MKIMVFDVPAEKDGALTILNQYYDAAVRDKEKEWVFVISTPQLRETSNVKILNYPWVKKSWFHRLYFDKFIASKLVKKHKPDEVLSLQNVVVPNVKVKQTLYLHQPLPFVEKRYEITENFTFWMYQNVISKMIYRSIRKADNVIVQTKWIRDAAMEKADVKKEKFILKQPELNIEVKRLYEQEDPDKKLFFYPATCLDYKNHQVIVDAVLKMSSQERKKCEIVFTLEGDENQLAEELYRITKENLLPIRFVGKITIQEVYEYYSKSILIFPSYIETLGLPLLEAKEHNCPIIASDCAFSRELLEKYDKVEFFDPFEEKQLFLLIEQHLAVS